MKTYILIGAIEDRYAEYLTEKGGHIWRGEEVKLEFDAPSWAIAKVVKDVYNEDIDDIDEFIEYLIAFYGYKAIKNE